MGQRANPSGIRLSERDVAVVKAMLARGDRQHDIAAWFGVNGGRIGEIASGRKYRSVPATTDANLPPVGPYPTGRDATVALQALVAARAAIDSAEAIVRQYAK
ncbi:MAG: hypothetical protein ACK4TG_01540 [Thermaurantiacus sp.]